MVSRTSSATWAMPKSMTTGSPSSISTLAGLRSRWTTPARVDRVERRGQAAAELHQVPGRHRAALADLGVEGRAGHVPGHEVGLVAVDVGVEDLGDRGCRTRPQRRDLAVQPGPRVRVVGDVRAQHLDRDRAAVRVQAEVDHAHAALAEPLHEPVRPSVTPSELRRARSWTGRQGVAHGE